MNAPPSDIVAKRDVTKDKMISTDSRNDVKPDDVLQQLGGCGRFQFLLAFIVQAMKLVVAWSMGGNAFFAYVPKWRCSDVVLSNITTNITAYNHVLNLTESTTKPDNWWNKKCELPSGDKCTNFEFDGEVHTLVDEFVLICDKSWVTASIISIQMSGMMVGSIVVGPLSDMFGRKKPFISSMVFLVVFQVMCYLSGSWMVFASARFFIGIGCAFFLSTENVLEGEFMLSKWRSTVISFPSWAAAMVLFTLVAWLLHDWEHLTLAIVIGSFLYLSSWFFIPESFRWLMTQSKIQEARDLVSRIAKWNKQPLPEFDHVARAFTSDSEESMNYSLIVLLRNRSLLKLTLPLIIPWLSLGLIGYGIGFGLKKLSGNFFLNLFIFSVIPNPWKFLTIYLQNKIGRRYTAMLSYSLCVVSGFIVGTIQYIDTPHRGIVTNIFAFLANTGVHGAWGPMQTLTVEVYPTAARTTGYGFLSTMARFGAVLGPQFVYLEDFVSGLLYFVIGGLGMASILGIAFLPETMNTKLIDKINKELEHKRCPEHQEEAETLLDKRIPDDANEMEKIDKDIGV